MSQIQNFRTGGGGGGDVDTLTGNAGGPVSPDGVGNINVVGVGGVVVFGTPISNTLTITNDDNVGFDTIVEQVFTSSGLYTPTADMTYCIIEVLGGGGAGGGSDQSSGGNSGGGAGGYARGVFTATDIGFSQVVTIGSGGIAASNTSGTAGGTSSVGALISATGGAGGLKNTAGIPSIAQGGVGSGGYLNLTGEDSEAVNGNWGGIGGDTLYGSGGSCPYGVGGSLDPVNGNPGEGYGSGGGGGSITTNPAFPSTGGNGMPGLVLITEYINSGGTSPIAPHTPYAVITAGATPFGALQDVGSTGLSGQVLTSNGAGMLPSWQTGSGGGGGVKVTTFNVADSPAVWTKDINCKYVKVIGVAGGGGGACGVDDSNGGGGGQCGGTFIFEGIPNFFGATENVVVGAGGIGGLQINLPATAGTNGGNTTFGKMTAVGGGLAEGLDPVPQNCVNMSLYNSQLVSTSGSGSGADQGGNGQGVAPFDGYSGFNITFSSTGAGGGGGYSLGVPRIGGDGGSIESPLDNNPTRVLVGGTGGDPFGVVDGGNGNDWLYGVGGGVMTCGTSGGGGACGTLANASGNGGNGGFPGGAGGGGGRGEGVPSGNGGNGADGIVLVIEYL